MASYVDAESLDELLVTLLEKYRPHLQTHSHRMKTWQNLLNEFNSISGLSYRQTRTLKRRFEKLRTVYSKFGKVNIGNIDVFKNLICQFDFERQKSGDCNLGGPSSPHRLGNEEEKEEERELVVKKHKPSVELELLDDRNDIDGTQVVLEEDSENEAPLDSITVLPHSHMRQLQKCRSDAIGQKSGASGAGISETPSLNMFASEQSKPIDVDVRHEIIRLIDRIEEKHQEDIKFRQQVMYKLEYIASLLQNK